MRRRSTRRPDGRRGSEFAWFGFAILGLCVYFSWHHFVESGQVAHDATRSATKSGLPHSPTSKSLSDSVIATVVAVTDGDSIVVSIRGEPGETRLRLEGIDAPEFSQPFYYQAKRYLSDACLNETVTFHGRERDRYDRIVGRVYVDSRDIGLDLLKAGLAWHFVRYNNEPAYANAESEARRRGRGLWADSHPVPPWEWRRNHDTQSKNRSDQ